MVSVCLLQLRSRFQLRALIRPNPVLYLMGGGVYSTAFTFSSPPSTPSSASATSRRERAFKNCMRPQRGGARPNNHLCLQYTLLGPPHKFRGWSASSVNRKILCHKECSRGHGRTLAIASHLHTDCYRWVERCGVWSILRARSTAASTARPILLSSFHTMNGKPYLFNNVANISVGVYEERMMITGMHTVADIFCLRCGSVLGWRYENVNDKNQKYKEGKSVLERIKISGSDGSNHGSDADDA